MKKIRGVFVIGMLFVSSCVPVAVTSTNFPTSLPSMTPGFSQTLTPGPSSTPTELPTATLTPEFAFNLQCPPLQDYLPNEISTGVISYSGRFVDGRSLLNLENDEKSLLPDDTGGFAIVSQDKNKIAYSKHDPNTLEMFLVIQVLDEHKRFEMSWPFIYSLGMPRWQNNDQILFTLRAEDNADPKDLHPYRNAVINPFTNEVKILDPDFPHISEKLINWNRAGSAVYDQTLDYVVYATWNEAENKHEYVFWHIPSQTELAVLPGNTYGGYTVAYAELISVDGVSYNPPVWSTDDTRVAVISSSPENINVDEIFTITKDGNIQQLTEFFNQFEQASIRTLSWSPDGKQLAFFITTEPDLYRTPRNERLAVLDTETRQVTLYCIEGDVIGTRAGMFIGDEQQVPAPLWSPDGTQLIIENRYESNGSRLILLDIPSNTTFEIGQNMQPVGWMLSMPK